MKGKIGGELTLLLVAFIWGTSFVAQRTGMEHIGPFTFNGIRMIIGVLFLIPIIVFIDKREKRLLKENGEENNREKSLEAKIVERRNLVAGGIYCGVVIFFASTIQQMGLIYTTAGKGGFITALYIVFVPVMGLLIGKKVHTKIWGCVLLAVVGLYLLSITEDFSVNIGDVLVLGSAFGFAIHILVIDHYTSKVNGVKLSAVQFLVAGIISIPCMLIFEEITKEGLREAAFPMLYVGIFSCGVAYTLQIIAQKKVEPTMTCLILSLESVIAVIAGIILLDETVNSREIIGCVLMFTAIIIAQLPTKEERRVKNE